MHIHIPKKAITVASGIVVIIAALTLFNVFTLMVHTAVCMVGFFGVCLVLGETKHWIKYATDSQYRQWRQRGY